MNDQSVILSHGGQKKREEQSGCKFTCCGAGKLLKGKCFVNVHQELFDAKVLAKSAAERRLEPQKWQGKTQQRLKELTGWRRQL